MFLIYSVFIIFNFNERYNSWITVFKKKSYSSSALRIWMNPSNLLLERIDWNTVSTSLVTMGWYPLAVWGRYDAKIPWRIHFLVQFTEKTKFRLLKYNSVSFQFISIGTFVSNKCFDMNVNEHYGWFSVSYKVSPWSIFGVFEGLVCKTYDC